METDILARYEDGVFKPLKKVMGISEGQIVDLAVVTKLQELAMRGGSFDFLEEEEELYTIADVLPN